VPGWPFAGGDAVAEVCGDALVGPWHPDLWRSSYGLARV
jgi:hypothetical protein